MRSAFAAWLPVAMIVTPHPASTEPDTAPASPFASMLAMVPASSFESGSDAVLTYIDMEVASTEVEVANAGDPLEHLFDVGIEIGWPRLFGDFAAEIAEAEAEVGFSTLDIEREVAVLLPPSTLIIDETSAARSDVVAALESNAVWSPELTEVESGHGVYFSWGDDLVVDPARRSAFRPLGQAGQFAVFGDDAVTTVRTLASADMEATLATIDGSAEPASGGDVLAPVLDVLGDSLVLQLMAVARPPTLGMPPDVNPELVEELAAGGLEPYTGLAIAELVTDAGRSAEVYLVHGDDATAAANAELVERYVTEGIDPLTARPVAELLPGAEVSVDGSVVRVTVLGDGGFRVLRQMLLSQVLFPVG